MSRSTPNEARVNCLGTQEKSRQRRTSSAQGTEVEDGPLKCPALGLVVVAGPSGWGAEVSSGVLGPGRRRSQPREAETSTLSAMSTRNPIWPVVLMVVGLALLVAVCAAPRFIPGV